MFVEMFDEMFVVGSWNRYTLQKQKSCTKQQRRMMMMMVICLSLSLYSWVILVLLPQLDWIVCSSVCSSVGQFLTFFYEEPLGFQF